MRATAGTEDRGPRYTPRAMKARHGLLLAVAAIILGGIVAAAAQAFGFF